jgi:endonuclease YncB( thermonuclease family)
VACFGYDGEIDKAGEQAGKYHVWPVVNLNAQITQEGFAFAFPPGSRDYGYAEATAERERNGIWRGKFIKPWAWRKGMRKLNPRI